MATRRLTVGNRSNDEVNISSVAGSGPYTVTLAGAPPVGTVVGDVLSDEAAIPNVYLISAIDGADLTVRDVLGAGVAPSAAGSSQAFTRRAYTTLKTAEAVLDSSTIFSAGDTAELAVCESIGWGSSENDNWTIDGGGTIGLSLIHILGHENYRHSGAPGTTARIYDQDGRNYILLGSPVPIRVSWLEFYRTGASYNHYQLLRAGGNSTVDHCLFHTSGTAAPGTLYGVRFNCTAGSFHNNWIWEIPTSTDGRGLYLEGSFATVTVYNNTIIAAGDIGIGHNGTGIVVRNNIVHGSATRDFADISWGATSSHNNSSDTSAPGSNSLTSQVTADTLVDVDNDDLHIKLDSGATGISLVGAETDIEIDIDGETRSGLWFMGADQATEPPFSGSTNTAWDGEMYTRQIDTGTHPIPFFLALTADNSGATGKTCTVNIRKPGGSFGAADGSVSEIASGYYDWIGSATDRDTLGDLTVHITAPDCNPVQFVVAVVEHDPFDQSAGGGTATLENQQTIDGKLDDIMGVTFVTGTHSLDQTADVGALADAVCDENVVTAHGNANSLGLLVRALGAAIAARANNATLNDLLGVPDQVNKTVVTEVASGETALPHLMHSTSIATVSTQTSMTLTTGSTDNNAYTNCLAVFTDQTTSTQKATVRITAYTGGTRTMTLEAAPAFVIAPGDSVSIIADATAPVSTASVQAIENAIFDSDRSEHVTAGSFGESLQTTYWVQGYTMVPDAVDEHRNIRWMRNGVPVTSGVTNATIRVINSDTGVDLIPTTSLVEAGSTHIFKYDASGAQKTATGTAYRVVFNATIDGATRTYEDRILRS